MDINHNVCVVVKIMQQTTTNWTNLQKKTFKNDTLMKGGEPREYLCFLTECGLLVCFVGRLDHNQ